MCLPQPAHSCVPVTPVPFVVTPLGTWDLTSSDSLPKHNTYTLEQNSAKVIPTLNLSTYVMTLIRLNILPWIHLEEVKKRGAKIRMLEKQNMYNRAYPQILCVSSSVDITDLIGGRRATNQSAKVRAASHWSQVQHFDFKQLIKKIFNVIFCPFCLVCI